MKYLKNKVSIVFIILGILLIISAITMKLMTEYQKKSLISNYNIYQEQLLENESREEYQRVVESLVSEKETAETNQAKNAIKEIKTGDTIAVIKIPKIKLESAVCEGVDNDVIRYAVGHFPETSLPGENGNFAVTGHRNYVFGQYFNRLDELEAGDFVIVESENKKYTYEVSDKFVVEPEELWVLDDIEEETITLITCTPIRVATHRLIVKGKLVDAK